MPIIKHIGTQIHITRFGKGKPNIITPFGNSLHKPHGGMWTSTFNKKGMYKSEWHEFIMHNVPEWFGSAWLVYPKNTLKIFDLASTNDIQWLIDDGYAVYDPQAYENQFEHREYYSDPYTLFNRRYIINWDELGKKFDALHIPRYMTPRYMDGWDVESTVWFKDKFEKIERYFYK